MYGSDAYHNNPVDFINSLQKVEVNINKNTEFVSHNQHSQENSWCLLVKTKLKREKEDPTPQDRCYIERGKDQKWKTPQKKSLKDKIEWWRRKLKSIDSREQSGVFINLLHKIPT